VHKKNYPRGYMRMRVYIFVIVVVADHCLPISVIFKLFVISNLSYVESC
jgi:hypothetical protein